MAVIEPTLALEERLLTTASTVIGMDEVGRGAIAGPVCVGTCAIVQEDLADGFPAGLRDSKLMSPKRREAIEPLVREWGHGRAVGSASVAEIETHGIAWALAHAGKRALAELYAQGIDVATAVILLDGSHDWLSPHLTHPLQVLVRPKADRDCAVVAAASVLAKVERDAHMMVLGGEEDPFAWVSNKGYASAQHTSAIRALGPSEHHRLSWLTKILQADAGSEPAGTVAANPA